MSWNVSMVPGTGLEPASREAADFRHTASFDAGDGATIAVRALDYAFAISANTNTFVCAELGAPRLVSTPSAKRPLGRVFGLGSALPRRRRRAFAGTGARGFTEFEGFCTGRFRPGTQLLKSAMFTNFITRAGRTRFYHRSRRMPLGRRHRDSDWRMVKRILG